MSHKKLLTVLDQAFLTAAHKNYLTVEYKKLLTAECKKLLDISMTLAYNVKRFYRMTGGRLMRPPVKV